MSELSRPPPEHAVTLGACGWLLFLSKAAGITFVLLYKSVKALLGGQKHGLPLYEFIAYTGMRDYQSRLPAIQIQNILPSTFKICTKFAARHALPISEIRLPNNTIAFRLGQQPPQPGQNHKTIVFFHGGGYMSPTLGQQILMAFGYNPKTFTQNDISVIVLQYDLASENANHYPRQLQQTVSLMTHLVQHEKIPPSSITLMGDSAGAHLLISLLLHLSHPNPQVPPLDIDRNFSAAIMVSPWVCLLNSSSESAETNKHIDVLDINALSYWAKNFLGDADLDLWNNPLTAPPEWWETVPVDHMFISYGENELFRDDIARLCEIIQPHHANTTTIKNSRELHEHMIMNRFLRINKPCESEKAFVRWLNQHFGIEVKDE